MPIPWALCCAGLPEGVRECCRRARAEGWNALILDGAAKGLRARELGRSARRELAATLRRAELFLAGIDLWIPPEHFERADRVDRALAACAEALALASELARPAGAGRDGVPRPVLSLALPEALTPAVASSLARASEREGVRIADHSPRARPLEGIGTGLLPQELARRGVDVASHAASHPAPDLVRLDAGEAARGRVFPRSRDEIVVLEGAASAAGYRGVLALDARESAAPWDDLARAISLRAATA